MVILYAVTTVKPEERGRALELCTAVAEASRTEDACDSYLVSESIETPNTFIFVEEWASRDGLYAHFRTPHFLEFMGGLGEVLAGPPVGTVSEASSTMTLVDAIGAAG